MMQRDTDGVLNCAPRPASGVRRPASGVLAHARPWRPSAPGFQPCCGVVWELLAMACSFVDTAGRSC
jgi:hypothetical protein